LYHSRNLVTTATGKSGNRHMDGVTERDKLLALAKLSQIEKDEALKMIGALKVMLMPDAGADGGLTPSNRLRCFKLVVELGQLLCKSQGAVQ
jgi:hypothetical protein